MSITDSFIKTYADKTYKYTTTVRHQGTVIAFAMDNQRCIYYSILDLNQADDSKNTSLDVNHWFETPRKLPFPKEITQVGFSVVNVTPMPLVKKGNAQPVAPSIQLKPEEVDSFLSTTARLSADAPFQVISDGKNICVFRQAIAKNDPTQVKMGETAIVDSTLLLDRFVLVGNTLEPKREVRYQRSRHKTRPLSDKDSLNAIDMEGNPFIEPTQELDFVKNLSQGRFTVLILPTQIATIRRWQIFAFNRKTQAIDSYNLEQSSDGLFNTQGTAVSETRTVSESALSFNGKDNVVEIAKPNLPIGNSAYTIEAWVEGKGTIISWSKNALKITDSGLASSWTNQNLVAQAPFKKGWHHVASTYDGKTRMLYLDGVVIGQDQPPQPNFPESTIAQIGAFENQDFFAGTIDEIRIWERAKDTLEIAQGMSQRLVGNEPGLVAYWRFDEAEGNRTLDQTDSAQHGTIRGTATWVKSDAPIQDSIGLNRDSFQMSGREIASGLSALMYYQQEKEVGGYNQERKPFKQNARVMLALNTKAPNTAPEISILDFAISREGKLAQLPDNVNLPQLIMEPALSQASIEARRTRISQLKQEIQTLENTLPTTPKATFFSGFRFQGLSFTLSAGSESGFRQLSFINSIQIEPGAIVRLNSFPATILRESGDVNSDLSGMFNTVKVEESPEHRDRRIKQQQQIEQLKRDLQNEESLLAGALSRAQGELFVSMKLLAIDKNGLTVSGGVLQRINANDTPSLFDSATGKLALYFQGMDNQFRAAYYDTLTAKASFPLPGSNVICVARSTEAELDNLTVRIEGTDSRTCTVTIGGAESIQEVWQKVPRDPARFAAVLNGAIADPLKIATIAAAIDSGSITTLTVRNLARSLQVGDLLQMGEIVFTVAKASDRTTTTIEVEKTTLSDAIAENTSIELIEYNYRNATSNRLLADLNYGSLLVRIAEAGSDPVQNGTARSTQPTTSCRWVGVVPGNVLALSGNESGTLETPSQLSQLEFTRTLSLEAWIKPDAFTARRRILQQKTAETQYSLGVEQRSVLSALQFGTADFVNLGSPDDLELSKGDFTIEAWVQAPNFATTLNNPSGFYGILGTNSDNANEVLSLGVLRGRPSFSLVSVGEPLSGRTPLNPNTWYHLAFRYNSKTAQLSIFVNGVLDGSATTPIVGFPGRGNVTLGRVGGDKLRPPIVVSRQPAQPNFHGLFQGMIDDVRIWNRSRSDAEILADHKRRLTGNEQGLVRYWYFAGNVAKDYSRNRRDATIVGKPTLVNSPVTHYAFFANVGNQALVAKSVFPCGNWNHVAATFSQAYAVQLDGQSGYLDCGNSVTLDISRDLTIEAFIRPNGTARQGIITKGKINDGTDQSVPYSLSVQFDDQQGSLVFEFETTDGTLQSFTAPSPALRVGQFAKVAVTRKYDSQLTEDKKTLIEKYIITFYVNGQPIGSSIYPTNESFKNAGSSDRALEIGKAYNLDGSDAFFNGIISEARIWNEARTELGGILTGNEKGLVAWWRFSEAEGTVVADSKGNNHATLKAGYSWVKTPDPNGSKLVLYAEGVPVPTESIANTAASTDQFTIGALMNATTAQESFIGAIKELRVWKTVRTQEQFQDNLFTPLLDEREDLIAYYPCNADNDTKLLDQSLNGNHLVFARSGQRMLPPYAVSRAPVGLDIPQIQVALSDVRTTYHDVLHRQPSAQEYGEMQLDTVGNRFGVLKRCYSLIKNDQWQLITGFKVGNLITEWVGQVQSDPQLIGFIEGAPPVPSENLTLKEDYSSASAVELTEAQSTNYTYASSRDKGFDMAIEGSATFGVKSETGVGLGVVTSMEDTNIRLGVKTSFENSLGWLEDASSGSGVTTTKASKMELQGNTIEGRFIPRNIGFALVQSETADVFALRLQHNNALVSYQMRPNPDIPKDWNVLTFPINATYTKQGTLDGKVGLSADEQYPNAMTHSSDSSYFKPIEAYSLKNRIQREQEQLKAEFDQFDAGGIGRRQSVLHFSQADLAEGRSLDKLPKLHKRNLVNTYVWTADGGLFAETEETMDVQQETMGGSYAFKGMAGLSFSADVMASKVAMSFELQALFGGHLNLTVTKSAESQTAFGVNVDLDVERDIMQRDREGNLVLDQARQPKKQPGKVDAYRFMTFYLEPKTNHFDEFFNRIVDPIWLSQGNDPNAIALREAQQVETKPDCWRVMHRVTYVSRVLEDVPSSAQLSPLERTLPTIDLSSNYELIRKLDPLVRGQKDSYATLSDAVGNALSRYLPELLPHKNEVIQFMADYYGTLPN